MEVTITPNIVVCPHCEHKFQNNKVNGIALVELSSVIDAKMRMHCRLTLNTLELEYPDRKIPAPVKKAVLDGYNDLTRSIYATLGFGTQAE